MIVKLYLKNRFDTATSISRAFREQIEGQSLQKLFFTKGKISCKSLISRKNQKARLDSTTEHIAWTEGQWNMVDFSDESKFNLFGSDGKIFVRRSKNGESLSPQYVKKLWNLMGCNGVWDDFFSSSSTHCSFSW